MIYVLGLLTLGVLQYVACTSGLVRFTALVSLQQAASLPRPSLLIKIQLKKNHCGQGTLSIDIRNLCCRY